jgi:hypothetical protein
MPPMTPPVAPPAISSTFFLKFDKKTKRGKTITKKQQEKLKAEGRAYRASLGAVLLGIRGERGKARRYTGLELRPIVNGRKKRQKYKPEEALKFI